MNKLFKLTKKFMLLAATVVMMFATTLVVLGAVQTSEEAAKYSALTILKVGTHTKDSKTDEFKYDKFGNKTIGTAKPVLYTNGYTAAEEEWMGNQPQFEVDLTNTQEFAEMVKLDNFIKLEVSARVGYDDYSDKNYDGKIDAYTNGEFVVKSSDERVATVIQGTEPKWDNEGKEYESQYIIITAGEKTGTATIKLTEANPVNPKKPKTASVKVTVKKLVDNIGFDTDVVKTDKNGELYTEVGVKGKATLGTTPTADASKKTVKYVLDATAKKYISVTNKGVITAKKSTADLEDGYVTVRVVAQDMQYSYINARGKTTKTTWGINETIKVYVADPTVKSAKILNVGLKNSADYFEKYKKAQSYETVNLVTNVSSDAHMFKLQVAAYSGTKWSGAEKANAVRFTTSNAKVATVDKNGVITAKANGSATITVVPADGVALSGKEALKVSVKVTTDVEKIETAKTYFESLAGKAYTIKANVNAGVSNSKAKGLKYEIVDAIPAAPLAEGEKYVINAKKNQTTTDFKEYVVGITGAKNEAAGKIRSDVEGEVLVRISLKDVAIAEAHPDVEKFVTIKFIDPISKITATVPVYQDVYKDKQLEIPFDYTPSKDSSKVTLYVDRNRYETEAWPVVYETIDDTCVIKTTVSKKYTGEAGLADLLVPGKEKLRVTSSNENVVKVLGLVEDGFEVQAIGKGKAKVTIEALDGSKVKKAVEITVVQKVNEINVTNESDGQIYLAPDKKGATKTTFKAVTNADANNTKVTYSFTPDVNLYFNEKTKAIYNKLSGKTSSISLTKADNAILFPEGGNAEPVLLGTLKVTAKDALRFEKYIAPEVNHYPVSEEVEVYAVKATEYIEAGELADIVDDMVEKLADGEEGITLYKGDKLDLAAALEIPAEVTDRKVTWSVGATKKDTDKNYISVSSAGVLTAKKATVVGDNVTVNVTMNVWDAEAEKVVAIPETVEVRVIPSQADYKAELNTQITTLLKENNYTWLGAKPKFDAKKATVTLTISDITMGKEAADAEMKEKLTSVLNVFKDATDVVKKVTATKYRGVSVYDAVAGKTWTLQLVGDSVVVFENGVEIGRYAGLTESNAALNKLMSLITTDIDDIVEWANRKLVVTLNADSTASIPGTDRTEQFNDKTYTTEYTIAVTVNEKDVEAFVDNKVAKAVNAFAVKNAGKEANTGIEAVTYNADKNTTLVEIYNGSVAIKDVVSMVKADAVASLEDIFMNAVNARVEIVENNVRRAVEFNRNENSNVETLVARLYTELTKELGENATMKDLEGIAVYASVDFDFAGTVYTKSYEVSFQRTVVSVDAEIDRRTNAFVNGLEENPYITMDYSDVDNLAVVTVTDFDATLETAANVVVGKVAALVNIFTDDAHVAAAKVNAVEVEAGKVTADKILELVKPADAYVLADLVGATATVEVRYDKGQVIHYIVKFQTDYDQASANIAAAVDAKANEINWAGITEELIVLEASVETENTVVIALNETKASEAIASLEGSTLYSLVETILTEASANCADSVTLSAGKKSVTVELAANEMSVSDILDNLAIKTVGNLSKAPINIVIALQDGRSINYVIKFVNANSEGGIKRNPLQVPMLEEGKSSIKFTTKVKAGRVAYYTGNIGEMIMTVTGKNAYVVHNGKTYTAVNNVVTVEIGAASRWNPAVPAIGNSGSKDATFTVEFAYPEGHMMNPEVISELGTVETYFDGITAEGNMSGYAYSYKAEKTGSVTLWFAEVAEDIEPYIEVSTTASYKVYILNEDGVEDWKGDLFLTVPVTEGDELTIRVGACPDENYEYPEMEYSLAATFEYPEGHESNPMDLGTITIPSDTTKVTVKAGETVWYESASVAGNLMQIFGATDCTVTYNGTEYKANEDGLVELTFGYSMGFRPIAFAITNGTEADAEYTLRFNYPVGSEGNPAPIILSEDGTTTFEVPAYSAMYYSSGRAIFGKEMVITDVAGCTVTVLGRTIAADANGTVSVVLPTERDTWGQPITISITNDNEEDVVLAAKFAVQEGTMDNPKVIAELGNYEVELKEGNNGYFFTWTAEKAGTLTFDISATEGGWTYCLNNLWQSKYGDMHWSDDETVVASESIKVEAGDLVQIIVSTYDPKGTSPAGTIKFAIDFAE